MNILKIAVALALPVSAALAQTYTPQGRLTLTSNTPVMTADATAQTSVYYAPYVGNQIPIYNGTSLANNAFSQLTMTLNTSNQTSGNIYDLFVFLNSGTVTIGAGPAWSSGTSRGTGSGTTQLTQLDGLWVNANSITLTNGSTSYSSIPADEATYVGSVYMTANGETGMQFKPTATAGGTDNVMGLYNAYNRVRTISRCIDSTTSSWTYSTSTWEALNAGGTGSGLNNRISFLDGLQQSFVDAELQIDLSTSSSSVGANVAVGLDSTSASPGGAIGLSFSTAEIPIHAFDHFTPQLGFHYVTGQQWASGATVTFNTNSGTTEALRVELEM